MCQINLDKLRIARASNNGGRKRRFTIGAKGAYYAAHRAVRFNALLGVGVK